MKEYGLVETVKEWNVLRNKFQPEQSEDAAYMYQFLAAQSDRFRVSHLSHKLISVFDKDVIEDIQNIII